MQPEWPVITSPRRHITTVGPLGAWPAQSSGESASGAPRGDRNSIRPSNSGFVKAIRHGRHRSLILYTISPGTGVWISTDNMLVGFSPNSTTIYTVISSGALVRLMILRYLICDHSAGGRFCVHARRTAAFRYFRSHLPIKAAGRSRHQWF